MTPDPIDLELQRLAWMDTHFDEMIEAARRHDDEGYAKAKSAFHSLSREAGVANNAPASNQ